MLIGLLLTICVLAVPTAAPTTRNELASASKLSQSVGIPPRPDLSAWPIREHEERFRLIVFRQADHPAEDDAAEEAAAGKLVVEAGEGQYQITIDTTQAAHLTEWARDELAPVVQQWYPRIVELLPSDNFTAPRSVSITFTPEYRGVAAASGTRIQGSPTWFQRNLDGEAKGAIVHELVHVVQQYGRGRRGNRQATRPPGWLVEGIADYIRWFLYEPETRGAEITRAGLESARHDASYRISGNFLNWVTHTHAEELVPKLNAALRAGSYRESLWHELTGKTLGELEEQWRAALLQELDAGADRTSGLTPAPAAP